jgi:hypothetical protein
MPSWIEKRRAISPPVREILREGPGTLLLVVFWALVLLGPPIAIAMTAGQLGASFSAETGLGLIGLVITLGALIRFSRQFSGR